MNEDKRLDQRLEILESSGMISSKTAAWTRNILQLLSLSSQKKEQEKLEMFVTHVAMALQRIQNGQYEKPLDRSIVNELEKEKKYGDAKEFVEKIRKIVGVEIPETEAEYLIAHLCNLFS